MPIEHISFADQLKGLRERVEDVEDVIRDVTPPDDEKLTAILLLLQEIRKNKNKNTDKESTPWRSLGYFLLGGMSCTFALYLLAISLT